MVAGIEILNDSGILQIDSNWRSLVMQAGLGLTVGGGSDPKAINRTGRTRPLLAYSGTALNTTGIVPFLDYVDIVGGSYTWYFKTGNVIGSPEAIALFDVPEPFPAHGAGLLIWDVDGAEAFDSNQQYMRVMDHFTWAPGAAPPPGRAGAIVNTGYSKPAGSPRWIVPLQTPWFLDDAYPAGGQYTVGTYAFGWVGDDLYAKRWDNASPVGSGTSQVAPVDILLIEPW